MLSMKAFLKFACCLLLSLTSVTSFTQNQFTKHYLFKNYNTQNGLINNAILSIAQDRQGFIWLGSSLGLSYFDGKTFYHNAVPDIYNNLAYVNNIETNYKGNIVCTAFMQGIFEQLDDGSFKKYCMLPLGVGKNVFNSIVQDMDGKLLIGSSRALRRIDSDSLHTLYYHEIARMVINTIDVDSSNTIWFGGIDGLGTMEPSGSECKPVFFPELKGQLITKILFDEKDVLHIGTAQGYFRIKFDEPYRQGSKYTISQPFDAVGTIDINNLYSDREQNLWILTSDDGAYRTRGDSITLHLTADNGLLYSSVFCMMHDRNGNYWFGTGAGLCMVEDFNSYTLVNIGNPNINNIKSDKYGRIWMPDQDFFYVYQDGRFSSFEMKNIGDIYDLHIDYQSVMWFYNNSGLFRLHLAENLPDMKKAEKVADLSVYNPMRIMNIDVDANGVWLCARNKILHFRHDRLLPVTFNHPDSSNIRPQVIKQDRFGYYWIGDYTNGLYRATLTENSKNKIVFDHVKVYKSDNPDSSFVTVWNRDMAIDREGNLWVASLYTGVYKHTLDSRGVVSSKLYSTRNGLLSNMITGVECRENGRVWIQTQNGTCIINQDASGIEHFDYLDKKDGIEGQPFVTIEEGDRLFTLTDEALFVTPNMLFEEKKKDVPLVVITGLSVNGVDHTSWIYKNEMLLLGHIQNNLTFEFSSVSFRRADDAAYQYRLDGINQDWSNLSERSFVEYSSLSPGKYAFNVRAVLDGSATGEETSFFFKIRPAFYKTIWFYLLIGIFVLSLLYSFYKYRISQVIRIERMRSRIASDLHDDIGSTLSSIFLMSEMANSNDKQSGLIEVLHKIGRNSRDILNSMDDIIWSVNPQDDSLASLIVRLREYAIPVCESRNIGLSMNIDDTAGSFKLEMDERRNIFLITKEAINNALKHSGCTTLAVVFTVNHKQVEVSVIDNGRGFDPQSPTSRNGVVNMKRRAQQINSELTICSEKNKGTRICLKTKNHIFI